MALGMVLGCGGNVMQGLGSSYYKDLLSSSCSLDFCEVVDAMDSHIPYNMAKSLNSTVAESEVKKALFPMNPIKSPGSDDMLMKRKRS